MINYATKQSRKLRRRLDCFVARAPRNDVETVRSIGLLVGRGEAAYGPSSIDSSTRRVKQNCSVDGPAFLKPLPACGCVFTHLLGRHSGARSCASHDAQLRIGESITPAGSMDSGPAPPVGYRRLKAHPGMTWGDMCESNSRARGEVGRRGKNHATR